MYCCSWTIVICVLFSHGCIRRTWTANVTFGNNATLSWYLPKPINKEFTVWNTRSGKPILSVTNYNNVTDISLESRITFTGSISPSGTGIFRFVISDVKFHDEGQYECYVGPPDNTGFTIDNCGHTLFVMAASTVYIRFGETATLAWNLHGSGMKEFWVRNDFWKSTIFHITKYNQVNIPSRTLRSRIVFTGHIPSTGTGLFSFMINDADDHDFGQYSCYKGSPQRQGAKVPNCGQNLVVIRVQEPYIESPGKATVGESVNLTCHSFLKSYPNWNLTMSFIWSRNGTRVEHDGKHKLESVSRSWTGGRFMTSTLTISGVTKKDRGDRYTCQTVVGENLLTDQSIDNVLGVSYIPDIQPRNTEAQVGDTDLLSMKTSVHQTKIYMIGPTDRLVFELDATKIYIREAYWTRIKVMKVITSLATVAVQFQLSDITSSDAGRYYCSLKPRGQTGCSWDHFLVVSNATVTVPASQSVLTSTTDDTLTAPVSQSEESSTKGYLTSTSTVRDDLTTVEPTTVKASSVPADDDANKTSAREYASFSTVSTLPSDGLSQSPVATVTTTNDASIAKGYLTSTSTVRDDLTIVEPTTVKASSVAADDDANKTSVKTETLSMVSIGLSAATALVMTVIGVSLCHRRIKRRKGSRKQRTSVLYVTPKYDEDDGYEIIKHI